MQNNSQMLQSILEALMTIETKGNNTITMSNCLQAMQQVIPGVAALERKIAEAAEPVGECEPANVIEE